MTRKRISLTLLIYVVLFEVGVCVSAEAAYPVAGVLPDRRPEGAPVILQAHKENGWYTRALTGISKPYPVSLKFLEDQGNWYTPFNHPGMSGRYDIRGWHQQ